MPSTDPTDLDTYRWLEDIEGGDAMTWVLERNAEAEATYFADPLFSTIRDDVLDVLEADDRIAYPSMHGDTVINYWTDATNRRGVLRRTSWADYRAGDPDWETVLDVDALGERERESWVFHGSNTRHSDRRRSLIDLSPGGSDASVTREFDMVDKAFVSPDDGGFVRPLAKGSMTWIDDDTVYVMTDFGDGTTTRSGYPRTVRRWRRGTPIEDAVVVFEGEDSDISVDATVDTVPGHEHHLISRSLDFYTSRTWILRDDEFAPIDVPVDVDVSTHGPWMTFQNRKPWKIGDTTHPGGSLLIAAIDGFLAGADEPRAIFTPDDHRALASSTWTRNRLVLNVMHDVRINLLVATPPDADGHDGTWNVEPLPGAPDLWIVAAAAVDADRSDDLWLYGNDLLTPESLYHLPAGGDPELLRQTPARFDASALGLSQHFATSADGTRVPYFEVRRTDATEPGPTLLGGYGGFEVARLPNYAPALGRAWLSAGATYVLANIRGGGEFGPRWHQAGLRERRPRVYEDFEAVADDLVRRGTTTPSQLACSGGSNGGLLVGNMYVRTPEKWGAIVCQVPLLDMERYHHLLAGASWMAEYGDPDDPDDWSFLRSYSPFHLVDPDVEHPPLLLTTSTRDDRVHPGHARKMASLLRDLGKDVTYWENVEGGHGGAADATQQATMQALIYTFLRSRLGIE